ncbi:MAG: type II secretion system F family protein [Candidatus Aminicenantes bacterium]|nr:type II secretion system F family protein [Candidatus Aminicenantes bacterium]
MPQFACRLATEDGRLLTETLLAPSREECRKHFEARGFCVLKVKKDWKRIDISFSRLNRKIREKDFILFNQELMYLLRAGYPVLKSLEIIINRTKNPNLLEVLLRVADEVRGGKTLSEAFLAMGRKFPAVYTASLQAGEQSGALPQTINRYLDYARNIEKTKSRIRRALVYPSLLLVFSFLLLMILINFILPRFSGFYSDFEADLPAVTRILTGFSLILRRSLLFLVPIALVLAAAVVWLKRKEANRVWLDRVMLGLPYARRIWLESGVSLFARTLGLLLEAGIALIQSVFIASRAIPNRFLLVKTASVPEDIRNGHSLSDALARAGFFPGLALDMIRIGETSANLEGMLAEVAEVYDDSVQARVDTFVTLIEPVLIIVMGLLVAVMLLSVYLPIFNIIKITR